MSGETGMTQIFARKSKASLAVMPASRMRRRVPRISPGWGGVWFPQAMGTAATLAMIGFGQVDQLKIKAEGARQLLCKSGIAGGDAGDRFRQQKIGLLQIALQPRFAAIRGDAAQIFHGLEERISRLLPKHAPEQRSQ